MLVATVFFQTFHRRLKSVCFLVSFPQVIPVSGVSTIANEGIRNGVLLIDMTFKQSFLVVTVPTKGAFENVGCAMFRMHMLQKRNLLQCFVLTHMARKRVSKSVFAINMSFQSPPKTITETTVRVPESLIHRVAGVGVDQQMLLLG